MVNLGKAQRPVAVGERREAVLRLAKIRKFSNDHTPAIKLACRLLASMIRGQATPSHSLATKVLPPSFPNIAREATALGSRHRRQRYDERELCL